MQYMLLIYLRETEITEEERTQCYAESAAYARELAEKGKYLAAAPLQPTLTATSVRTTQDGKRTITDGPFAETREQLGGYFLIDAANLDEAIDIASHLPGAKFGTVEIRPIIEVPGVPESLAS